MADDVDDRAQIVNDRLAQACALGRVARHATRDERRALALAPGLDLLPVHLLGTMRPGLEGGKLPRRPFKQGSRTLQDVIIVGGGPTGFITALGLARAGVRVSVIEAEPKIVDSPRAAVYHWSVVAGLETLGIREE